MFIKIISIMLFCISNLYAWNQNDSYWGSSERPLSGNLRLAQRITNIPEKISNQFLNKTIRVFSIDLDSNGKLDYIVTFDGEFKTCFIDSSFVMRYCNNWGVVDGFTYFYFAQLDSDPMLELFRFSGDEDNSDYTFLKFDPKTWTPYEITKIMPFIKAIDKKHTGIYWGYPWDIIDLPIKSTGKRLKTFMTFTNVPRNLIDEEDDNKGPLILFSGIPTQGDSQGSFNSLEKKIVWEPLKYVIKSAK